MYIYTLYIAMIEEKRKEKYSSVQVRFLRIYDFFQLIRHAHFQ